MSTTTYCMNCGNDFTRERPLCTDCSYCEACCICWDRQPRAWTAPSPTQALAAVDEEPVERARCKHCGRVIQRLSGNKEWTSARIGVSGRDAQCQSAPNPDDGPMPGHAPVPGSIVSNPAV